MSDGVTDNTQDPGSGAGNASQKPSGKGRLLISAAAALLLGLLVCSAIYMRPRARANRLLHVTGFGKLPVSVRSVFFEHQDRSFGRAAIFMRFDTTAEHVERLIQHGRVNEPNEPVALRSFRFGPKSPFAGEWNGTATGRVYHVQRNNASVWLAVNDDTKTVYMAVFEYRAPWLERLMQR